MLAASKFQPELLSSGAALNPLTSKGSCEAPGASVSGSGSVGTCCVTHHRLRLLAGQTGIGTQALCELLHSSATKYKLYGAEGGCGKVLLYTRMPSSTSSVCSQELAS